MISPRRRFLTVILAVAGAMVGASTASAVVPAPTFGGGPAQSPTTDTPTYTISGDPAGTINWTLLENGTPVSSNTGGSVGPIGVGQAANTVVVYTVEATQTADDPDTPELDLVTSDVSRVSFTRDIQAPTTPSIVGISGNLSNQLVQTLTWTPASPEVGGSFTWQLVGPGVSLGPAATTTASTQAQTLTAGQWTLQVTNADALGNTATATYTFTIDTTLPTVPALSQVLTGGAIAGFTSLASVNFNLGVASTDASGAVTYALNTTGVQPTLATDFTAWAAATQRQVTVATVPATGAPTNVFLWARDPAGNVAAAPAVLITFDSTRPTVATTLTSRPLPGANVTTDFGPAANVQISFSEPVQNPVSLIRLCLNPCGLAIPSTVTYSDAAGAILDPTPALGVGTSYEIELLTIRDRAGNTLNGPGSPTSPWTFSTSADGTPPAPVTNVQVTAGIGQLGLTWTRPGDPDLARITVLRGTSAPTSAGDATAARFSLPATATSFTDVGLVPGVTYFYAVYGEDIVGNPSELARASGIAKAPLVPIVGPRKPPKGIFDKLMTPKKGKVIGTLRPILRWRANPKAQFYNLQIEDLATGKKVVSAFPKHPSYRVPPKRLKAGHRYAWRVWAWRNKKIAYVKVPMTTWFAVGTKVKK